MLFSIISLGLITFISLLIYIVLGLTFIAIISWLIIACILISLLGNTVGTILAFIILVLIIYKNK